jgi:hypothetical protein
MTSPGLDMPYLMFIEGLTHTGHKRQYYSEAADTAFHYSNYIFQVNFTTCCVLFCGRP